MKAMLALLGTCAIAGAAAAATNTPPERRVALSRDGLSFVLPAGWHVTFERVNGVLDPVTLFTATTFRLRPQQTSSGLCSRALQRAWRADGAYVHLAEERDGASRKRMLRRVQLRPRHFKLDAQGAGGLCTPPNSGEIAFQDGGRAFYVFYGLGPKASRTTRAAASALLDKMRIAPRRR